MFQRHSLIFPTKEGWEKIKPQVQTSFQPIIDQWSLSNWPAVVRRQEKDNLAHELSIGIACVPNGHKMRLPLKIDLDDIAITRTVLELHEVIHAVPFSWRKPLQEMIDYANIQKLKICVFGSLAWQALTQELYLQKNSDIDLFFCPNNAHELKKFLALFENYKHVLPLDGEILFPGHQAVSIKEFMQVDTRSVIIKQQNDVKLIPKQKLIDLLNAPMMVAKLAIRGLYHEMKLDHKPGLVSPSDNGSHLDMTVKTLMKSIFSLRHYFLAISQAGFNGASFETLKALGIEAEKKMLLTTKGINTHRGAIFALGLLSAAISFALSSGLELTSETIKSTLLSKWGESLLLHAQKANQKGNQNSNGSKAQSLYGIPGAKMEAANGFPAIFEIALPIFQKTIKQRDFTCARIDALFALMAYVEDTNVYHRGGKMGADFVKQSAKSFREKGGTEQSDFALHLKEIHQAFVKRDLSPGGSADLLAATIFVHFALQKFSDNP